MKKIEEDWPEIISDEPITREEYGRVGEAVGELTSAILDCKLKGLLNPNIAKQLRGFMTSVLVTLEE